MSHLYKITDKDGNKVTFKKNKAQAHFEKNRHNRNIILKSRQLGFTTDEAVDALDDALFNKNFTALIINYEQKEAIKTFKDKIYFAWENLPEELKKFWQVDTQRANELMFDFGDKSYSSIATANSGRGGTPNRVHITEFAKLVRKYPQRATEIITGTIPAVPFSGRIDIESTAEGSDGLFYDMFWDAFNRKRKPERTEFKAHFYNWTWDEHELSKITTPILIENMDSGEIFREYQEKHKLTDQEITYYYLKWLAAEKSWNKLHQEFPTTPEEAFVGSGHKLFNQERLEELKNTLRHGTVYGEWVYYEPYIEDQFYVMGVDVAEGVGQDSSTAIILNVSGLRTRVVAEFCSKTTPPDLLSYEIAKVGREYGNCVIAVERNNHGHTTLATLKGIYGNIYTEVVQSKIDDTVTEKLGWYTSMSSKPKMMYELSEAMNQGLVEISSDALYEELRTYDKEDISRAKFNSEQSKHWDRVMALAIAWQMRAFATQSDEMECHSL